ncbi:MAG: hypothetical protein ABEJ61_07490 [Haloferacaceae archaeon]
MARGDDEELRDLLEELEGTLADLRAALDGTDGRRPGRATGRRRRGPPTPGELLRVTERHTIPTAVATLEATIRALELLGEVIRLTTGGDATDRGTRPLPAAGDGAAAGTERALDRLRTALAEADLPRDPATRELLDDARSLSEEIEGRLGETGRAAAGERGVDIEVRERDRDEVTADAVPEDGADAGGETAVDVEAELESIRDELDGQDET